MNYNNSSYHNLQKRAHTSSAQDGACNALKPGGKDSAKNSYLYHTGQKPDPGSSPQQAPLLLAVPPVLSAAADPSESNAPGIF